MRRLHSADRVTLQNQVHQLGTYYSSKSSSYLPMLSLQGMLLLPVMWMAVFGLVAGCVLRKMPRDPVSLSIGVLIADSNI